MDVSSEMVKVASEFVSHAGKRTVEAIWYKMRAVKEKGDKEEIIRNLEEIINDLIADRNQLIQIIQAYEEQLITQKLTEEDINYITENIVPLLEELLARSEGDDVVKFREGIDTIKPILSKETFSILQLLGFNFKKAIGEPLTELVRGLIASNIPAPTERAIEHQILMEKRQIEYFKVVQDEEAFQRHLKAIGRK